MKDDSIAEAETVSQPPTNPEASASSLVVDDDASDDDVNQTIDEKIAAARARLSSSHCLFCPHESASLEDNLTHMSSAHSFFIPDADYLIDIPGLISYLGEKIAVGNVCIFCNGKGREFRTLGAVRKHMIDKSHCKIAYESSDDRLEISDYYDFTSSYPEAQFKKKQREKVGGEGVKEEWEDLDSDDGEDVDEIVDENLSDSDSDSDSDSNESLSDNQITYGDSHLELVLPSGARIGHRTMRRYYAQSFPGAPRGGNAEDPNSGAALVRRLLADKNSALVPRKGGFGAYGSGTDVVKARNHGEAREAGRHIREFRDQKRREDFKTKVGFIHNSQKHFRDPREYIHINDHDAADVHDFPGKCSSSGTSLCHTIHLHYKLTFFPPVIVNVAGSLQACNHDIYIIMMDCLNHHIVLHLRIEFAAPYL
jgi:pre-60S factor REI1